MGESEENEFSARREDADGPYRRAVEDVDAAVGHGLVHEHRGEARRRAERDGGITNQRPGAGLLRV